MYGIVHTKLKHFTVMENVKEVIEKYRGEVMSSYPSIFTKEDVVQLLTKMEVDLSEVNFDGGSLEYYKETLIGEIRNIVNEDDIVDEVTLELNYGREIQVSVDVDSLVERLEDMVERVIRVPEVL